VLLLVRYLLPACIQPQTTRISLSSPHNRPPITDNSNSSSAFTLIELLVVITIILVLMGLLFPAIRGAQDQAKKVQAKNDLTQIVTAVNAFYTEYGRYPVLSTIGANGTYDDTNNDQLFNMLRGTADQGEQLSLNPRKIAFMNPPIAKNPNAPRSGIGQSDGKYYDPWGTPYRVRLDVNYINWVQTNPPYQNAPSWGGVNAGVVAWCYGKDGKLGADGNGDATASGFDDVLSWQ
jgi:prepilin-type N-terminal cleavage/methylation domain-containing protein